MPSNDKSRIDRLEQMLEEIHWQLLGQWTHAAMSMQMQTPNLAFTPTEPYPVSSSAMRRLRATRTRKRLWERVSSDELNTEQNMWKQKCDDIAQSKPSTSPAKSPVPDLKAKPSDDVVPKGWLSPEQVKAALDDVAAQSSAAMVKIWQEKLSNTCNRYESIIATLQSKVSSGLPAMEQGIRDLRQQQVQPSVAPANPGVIEQKPSNPMTPQVSDDLLRLCKLSDGSLDPCRALELIMGVSVSNQDSSES